VLLLSSYVEMTPLAPCPQTIDLSTVLYYQLTVMGFGNLLAPSSILRKEATSSSETSVLVCQIVCSLFPEHCTLTDLVFHHF
jgi:hypothetical protein